MPFLGRAGPRRSLIASGIVASAGTDSRDVLCAVSEIGARSRMVLEAVRLAIDGFARSGPLIRVPLRRRRRARTALRMPASAARRLASVSRGPNRRLLLGEGASTVPAPEDRPGRPRCRQEHSSDLGRLRTQKQSPAVRGSTKFRAELRSDRGRAARVSDVLEILRAELDRAFALMGRA